RPGLYGRPGHSETVVGTEADATSGAADAVENVERIHYKIQSPLSGSTSTPGGTASFRFRPVILGSHVSQAPQALSCKGSLRVRTSAFTGRFGGAGSQCGLGDGTSGTLGTPERELPQ